MMEPIAANILHRRTHICASVVFIVPHEIARHADFLRSVACSSGMPRTLWKCYRKRYIYCCLRVLV